MRIVIDMQGAQSESRFRGIGRYTHSLTEALVRHRGAHEVILAFNAQCKASIPDIRRGFQGLLPESAIRIFDVPISKEANHWVGLAAEQIREAFIESLEPDVVLVTSLFEHNYDKAVTSVGAYAGGNHTVVILYDLIPLLNQEQYLPTPEAREEYYRKIGWLKNAGLLLAISEHTRKEGLKYLEIPENRITTISTATDVMFHHVKLEAHSAKEILVKYDISRQMVMFAPGGFDPRKNFDRLIEAYSRLPRNIRNSHQLVIVSRLQQPQREELLAMRDRWGLDSDELILTGYVEDEELIALYTLTKLFVFPSVHEGFGLPVLEAMSCGAAVIGSDRTSIPEVIGWEEALFDPLSAESILKKMEQALTDENFRDQLQQHGLRQVQKYSWDFCAKKALKAMEGLHAKNQALNIESKSPENKTKNLLRSLSNLRIEGVNDHVLRATAGCIVYNDGSKKRQILLDVSTMVHADSSAGIQRVVRSLMQELMGNYTKTFDVRPIYWDGVQYQYANELGTTILKKGREDDYPVDFFQDDIYLSIDLNLHLTDQAYETHTYWRNRGVKFFFIVYDILPLRHPEWWPTNIFDIFKKWILKSIEVASGLICISFTVAEDVRDYLKVSPSLVENEDFFIRYFHLGADIENSIPSFGVPDTAKDVLEQIKSRGSFLMLGILEPRKGHMQTLLAFDRLWNHNQDINLVIVGKQGWMVDELVDRMRNHPELGKRLFWLDSISDEYLKKVYAASTCLIVASEGEGFGLPLIEASCHKLPILARDIPVFREVAGDHASYFRGMEAKDMADAIHQWLESLKNGEAPSSEGMPYLTWKESARQLMETILGESVQ